MASYGDLLRLARQKRGMTQKVSADLLGIPQAVLSRIENELTAVDESFLEKAALVYKVPVSFFSIRDPIYGPPVSVHPMLRGKADVTARELDMLTAELNIRLFNLRTFLESADYAPIADLPLLDVEEYGAPERIAATVRAHWGVVSGPIKDMTRLVERAGVIVGVSDFGGASISGATFRAPASPPLVVLNGTMPADRMRFTLAHELGHLVMHRFPTPTMEDEANKFACAFLMPENDIRPAFAGRKITLELLAALKLEWKVSIQALLMRAASLNAVTANQSRYLWQQISSRGWRLKEPPELESEPERPRVISSFIEHHTSGLRYTLEEMCRITKLHEADFIALYGPLKEQAHEKPRLRLVT